MLTPLIVNKTLTAQTASKVPKLTGSNAASNADQTSAENRECLRASTRIMLILKQTAGVTNSSSIQNNGVADQSPLKPLVAKNTQALANQRTEQMSSAIERADVETQFLDMLFVVVIYFLTVSLIFTHAQIGLTIKLSHCWPRSGQQLAEAN